jgi:serine/threonine-protein phosphatase PGAM5
MPRQHRFGVSLLELLRSKPVVIKCDEKRDTSDETWKRMHFGMWPEWTRQWNSDWDLRHPREETNKKIQGKTIHLIMIRHGQYDLKDKSRKGLTDLGKEQAELTGKRLGDMAKGAISDFYGKRKIRIVHLYHSNLTRAAETASIISKHLKDSNVEIVEDPMLAEGWPCLPDPYKDPACVRPSKLFEESARVEAVFRKYCHRHTDHKKSEKSKNEEKEAPAVGLADSNNKEDDANVSELEEEYIVCICHQNIIRYFVCRALQLPPEAWLRFRGSNCGITEIIISDDGRVSLEKFADVGHLPITHHTFH